MMTDKSACKYWDCGWCYAPNYLKTNAINSTCVNPYECPISPLSEPVQYETPMTEIEELKAQIKVLEAKMSLLEELEKTKSPVEEAFKDWWGQYPETGTWDSFDDKRWQGFQAGYEFAYAISTAKEVMEKVQEEQKWDAVRESVKWCEEHPDKNPLDWLKPQTPEQVADGLKEAFREAVKQGVVSSSTKSKTLTDIVYDWWCDIVTSHSDLDMEASIEDLVDRIELFLPKEQSAAGSQNAYVECSVEGFNDCLNKIKRKLR